MRNERANNRQRRPKPAQGAKQSTAPSSPPGGGRPSEVDEYEKARTIVLNQLTASARSRGELRAKLASREIPDDVAEAVLDRMEEVNLIDDAAFAQQWVISRHRSRGLARRSLALELRRKGIDHDEAEAALAQLDADDERQTARELVDRKLRSTRGQDEQARARKLASMLARKGYPAGLAFAVVREALADEGLTLDEPDA